MKQKIKHIFPAFLSLLSLSFFEFLNSLNGVKQNLKIDLQNIGNILLLIIGAYSICRIAIEMKQIQKQLEVYYLNNILIVASAFVLNIYIFENRVFKILDFFTGWNTIWSIWLMGIILWFINKEKCVYFRTQKGQGVKDKKRKNVIKIFLGTVIGAVIWLVAMQMFLPMFSTIGNILLIPIIILVLMITIFYVKEENLFKFLKIKWTDLAVVCAVVIGVTYILLPVVGAISEKGKSILAINNIEDFQTFMELITAGIEVVKEFL